MSDEPTWRAYDLPSPHPCAEALTYDEMCRFEEMGFHIEPTPGNPASYDLIRLEIERMAQADRNRRQVASKKARARARRRLRRKRGGSIAPIAAATDRGAGSR